MIIDICAIADFLSEFNDNKADIFFAK